MKHDWKKDRAKAVKHARLIKRKPELLAALYGSPPDHRTEKTRETAQGKGDGNG